MAKKSMIDADFIDDEEEESQFSFRDDGNDEPFEVLDVSDKKKEKKDDDIEIEVVSDAPEKDRDKWVADDDVDGQPDIPDDEEIKSYGKKVQKRLAQMTARLQAERRAKDDINRQLMEAAKFAETQMKRANQLSDLVENGEKVLLTEHKGRIEGQLAVAKNSYREAHDAGDVTGMMAAQENIAKLAAAMDRLSVHRPAPLQRTEEAEFKKAFAPAQPVVDETTQRWQEKNDWFGKDTVLTAFAMGVHSDLVNAKGISPNTQEYWRKLDSELHRRFPERFQRQGNAPRRSETIVAPPARGGSAEAKKVTLTESQVKLARRLGLTTEQYARQVMKESKEA